MIIGVFKRIKERKKQKMILAARRRREIEDKASQILERNNLLAPRFDLIKFLTEKENYEIFLQEMPKGTTGFVLVNEKNKILNTNSSKFIAINSELQNDPNFVQKSRFIVAHEYAHSILHKTGGAVFAHRSIAMRKTKMEQEADYFARCLLMPRKLLLPTVNDNNFKQLNLENQIKYIAEEFNVTTKKALERLKDLRHGSRI